jgi:SAM-dependent methyltransferase
MSGALPPDVYAKIRDGAIASARVIAPMVLAHLTAGDAGPRPYTPRVIDVGCGEGWFASALQAEGCHVTAIDVEAPPETALGVNVQPVDLEGAYELERNAYDLGVCLEVAEHLTEPAGARLVAELCASCRVIAWSAAIPGQGGSGHLTERWPTYWHEVFKANGYVLADPWRDALWDNPDVEPWYAQNLLLAMRATPGTLATVPAPRCLAHPTIYLARVENAAYWRERYLEAGRELDRFREALIVLPS